MQTFPKPLIGDDFIAYHLARAKGGCGLSILEAGSVHPSSRLDLALFGEEVVPGLQRLMSALKPYDMKVFQQLWHGGNLYPDFSGGLPWAVSDVPGYWGLVGREMTRDDIVVLRQAFVDAALRCQQGGLHGVEVHACHGYLFHQFLSPCYNQRQDEYGGSLENRSRFLFETMRAIRKATGKDFALGIRLGSSEMPGGVSVNDNKLILELLEKEGLVDFVDASKGDYYRMDTMVGSMQHPVGYELSSTADIVAQSKVPRIVTGRFRTLEEAEQVLREGQADLVSMVRAQIADPDLVRKTRDGLSIQVRPCIGCNQGCIGGLFRTGRMGCAVNPAVGAESTLSEELIERKAEQSKVLVVGGGPAGLEAARVSALMGHKVILAEAQPKLGGAVNIAYRAPHLHSLRDITYWLEQEVYRLGVEVRLGCFMEAEDILKEKADHVILATGSTPRLDGVQLAYPGLQVQGVDLPHVVSSHDVLTNNPSNLGSTALVLDTVGHYEGLAVTEFLLKQGLAVTYLSHTVSLSPYVQSTWRDVPALERCYSTGHLEQRLRHLLLKVQEGKCLIKPMQATDDQATWVVADTVVLVTPNKPMNELQTALNRQLNSLHRVGDALAPRDIQVAIADGHGIARGLH